MVTLSTSSPRISVSYRVLREGSFGNPRALVVFPWGSESIISVRWSGGGEGGS